MKKSFLNSIIPLAVFMLYISINGFSQIQNPNWVLFTTGDATATIGTTNIRFNSAPTIHYNENNTSYKNTPREFRDENNQPITNYRGFNSFFDNDGFPVLYVINKNQKTYLFDKHGKLISKKHENPNGYLYFLKNNPTGGNNPNYYDNKNFIEGFNEQLFSNTSNPMLENTSREISILKVGCNLLHVIAGSMIIEVDLSLKSWDYFLPKTNNNGSINCSFIQNKGIYSVKCGNGSMVFRETVHSIRRDPTNEARYFIHYLHTSDNVILGESNSILLNTIKIDANNYSVDYGPSFFLKHPSLPRRYGVSPQFVAELEVSPDGSKIAVHDDNSIFVYNINSSTKQVTGLLGWYIFGAATNTQNFAISGLEFNSNSTQLIFNRFNYGAPQFTQVQNNIGVLNLNNISSGQFACTWISEDPTGKTQSIVSRGGLELGRDGNIY